jgi:hypothetical protein
MTAKATRILKEARPLAWPWCAVTLAGVLPLVPSAPHSIAGNLVQAICLIGFFLGIPLLATLSLGNEFQHRTLAFLLTQPVERMEIWREKLSVTAVAVFSVALLFFFDWRMGALQLGPHFAEFAGAWTLATIASAAFWTLLARSTLGGIALNYCNLFIIMVWAFLPNRIRGAGNFSPATIAVVSAALLCYAGAMLWLGRRTFARFQATGGMAGDDLLMAGPDVMPGALAGWLRCRPRGVILNLIRKEIRLLRPLWLITLLAALGWTSLALFGLVPARGSNGNPVPMLIVGISSLLIAVLAGSLSLGEEKTSGTHAWHMTLPVSARRQWLIKLSVAMFAGPVCAVLLPVLAMIASGLRYGSPMMFVELHDVMIWLLAAALLSFASFWCASAVNGTVRAVVWILPVAYVLFFAVHFGVWVAANLVDLVVSRFDPFASLRFTSAISNVPLVSAPTRYHLLNSTDGMLLLVAMLWLIGTLLFAVIQSYRLFRAQPPDSVLSVLRSLLPVAASVLLCSLFFAAASLFVSHARLEVWTLLRETHKAIEQIQPGNRKPDAAHPLRLTVEDLAKASPLSERTRRWLSNSSITVAPDNAPLCCRDIYVPDKADSWYLVTIYLPNGPRCTMPFQPGRKLWFFGVCE